MGNFKNEFMKKEVFITSDGRFTDEENNIVKIPEMWEFLPAGDAGVTRNVTKAGEYIRVKQKRGRRLISKGVWAPKEAIEMAIAKMTTLRSTESYEKSKQYRAHKREKDLISYQEDFKKQIIIQLSFADIYHDIAVVLADKITQFATPIGSGTVARSSTLSLDLKAQKAINGWVRHRLTPYESLKIARVKGARANARKLMYEKGLKVFLPYQKGEEIPSNCPLKRELESGK